MNDLWQKYETEFFGKGVWVPWEYDGTEDIDGAAEGIRGREVDHVLK